MSVLSPLGKSPGIPCGQEEQQWTEKIGLRPRSPAVLGINISLVTLVSLSGGDSLGNSLLPFLDALMP